MINLILQKLSRYYPYLVEGANPSIILGPRHDLTKNCPLYTLYGDFSMLNTRLQTTQAQYKYTRLETAGPKPNQSVGSYIKEQTQPNDYWQMFYGYRG